MKEYQADTDFFVDAKYQTDTNYLFLTDTDMRYGYPLYGYWWENEFSE